MLKRAVPLIILVSGLVAFFALGLKEYLSFDALLDNRTWLSDFVANNVLFSAIVFLVLYTTIVAFSIPGAAVMSVTGGFLFGQWYGLLYNVSAATLGSAFLFIAARWAIGESRNKRMDRWLDRMEKGFRNNAFSYLMALRLVPVFPFWAVNLGSAILGVRFPTFILATFLGIIPGGFVFSTFGSGVSGILESGEMITLSAILTPQIITGLIGLALLALLPVAVKHFKKLKRG